jgi:CBS domain containing-hemolysin-like protein
LEIDDPLRLYLIFFLFWGLVFFTFSEAALFGLGRLGLQKLREEGHPSFPQIESLLSRPRQLIISLLIGNEAVNVAISSLTSALFIGLWGDTAKWLAIPVVVFLVLLFGEVIPKAMAIRHPEKVSPLVANSVARFVELVRPLYWVVQKILDLTLKLAGVSSAPSSAPLTEEDFKNLVETSHREGALEEAEKHLIHRVFEFGDKTVRNIMTPRAAVFALPVTSKLGDATEALKEHRFSRVPVYRRNLEEIVGILYSKDLLKARGQRKQGEEGGLRTFLRRPYFVPLSKKLDELFKEFQKQRMHMAIVVNEYGGMAGIVTLEDLLEELFGEIYDELDIERRARRRSGRGPAAVPHNGESLSQKEK